VLALRGWGERDFRYASPQSMATIRHALFAEAGVKILAETEQIVQMPVSHDMPASAQAEILRAKVPAEVDARRLRALLFPGDD
jgi:hypothetical protein